MGIDGLFQIPVIQGPMAGGACTPQLVAAVSNAGALGALPCSLLSPQAIAQQVAQIRSLTRSPFMLNFFVQGKPAPGEAEVSKAVELLRPVWESLGWDSLPLPKQWCEDFEAQFETLIALRPPAVSFTFGILESVQVERLHGAGIRVIGTVTTVAEALAWEAVGADAVVASGIEAGGHRGTFIGRQEEATLGAEELWPAVVAAVNIPVIAAGGIMTGADIRRALALGARAVQMGTAFLVTDEAALHPAYKARLLSGEGQTRLTRSFSGRYARGIENRFMRIMETAEPMVPPYPVQNALTGPIRAAAAKSGDTELMSMWAGTEFKRARPMPAADLVKLLADELANKLASE
ncbi:MULTISPECIES: nitronate monooxygenase family protein [unclassified Massilia]|uniref:NAD(P)H-dependent flavin oxidoreductase n=1 Tax=unclassified Massilia TaxID=2609279 RepID=UPI00178662E0|nr:MULTISPECIES: nitronate monooxygenase [unclassified Massilia]MBD8531796.1 nitronate monooxygenase [Massilia sp. CFBP 13647]MBD8675241.1 nitronate monooxygenase [Massilia sp. CFBP 13721]